MIGFRRAAALLVATVVGVAGAARAHGGTPAGGAGSAARASPNVAAASPADDATSGAEHRDELPAVADKGGKGGKADDGDDGVTARPSPLAVAAAAVPGLVYSGLGTRLAGDRATGRRLAWLHGASAGLLLAGGLPFAISGASRRTSGYAVPLLLLGSSGFFTTWWADIYGAATGGRSPRARTELPAVEAEVGYAYVVDPRFDYANIAAVSATGRAGPWSLRGDALIALDDPMTRAELAAAYRFFGPVAAGASATASDGSFVDLDIGAIAHRQGGDGFSVYTPFVAARGRLDMARVGPSLAGSFVDVSLGFGVEFYDVDDADGVTPVALQLARFGYGLYLGAPGGRYGELVAYYDHRHDELAAGLGTGLQFDGPWGHFGLSGFYYLSQRWGVGAEFEAGSAYVSRLSARVAWGRP